MGRPPAARFSRPSAAFQSSPAPEPIGLHLAVRAQGGECMPTYEYRCEDCGHQFTVVLSISEHEKAKQQCPKCKGEDVKQAVSAVFVKTSRKS
jgi:putative FmdB family regulatory protein